MDSMKANDIRLCFQFYKSIFFINASSSLFFSITLYFMFKYPIASSYAMFSMSLGYIFSIIIKESGFSNKHEYYFFYNFGISKIKLFIICGFMNTIFSLLIIIGYFYAK